MPDLNYAASDFFTLLFIFPLKVQLGFFSKTLEAPNGEKFAEKTFKFALSYAAENPALWLSACSEACENWKAAVGQPRGMWADSQAATSAGGSLPMLQDPSVPSPSYQGSLWSWYGLRCTGLGSILHPAGHKVSLADCWPSSDQLQIGGCLVGGNPHKASS